MIVVSMVLVIVGAVTLVIGVFFADDNLTFVYISIASCLLAGLFLVIGIVRGRPTGKPVPASGGEAQPASWSGASSAWQPSSPGGTTTVERDTEEEEAPSHAGGVQVVAEDEAREAEEDEDVTLVGEPSPKEVEEPEPAAPAVGAPAKKAAAKKAAGKKTLRPKRLGKKATGTRPLKALPRTPAAEKAPPEEEPAVAESPEEAPAAAPEPASAPGKKATRKTAAKKAAKKATRKTAAKKAAKRTTKKVTAKKAAKRTTKKVTAKKAAGKKTTGAKRDRRADFDEVMAEVTGVGPAKRDALFHHFGSVEALKDASVEEITEVKGISDTIARRLHDELH